VDLSWPFSRDPDVLQARLVTRARLGDSRAFGDLYEALHPRVWAFAARRCASAADAEDVVARTFHRLLERLERYEPGRGPVAAFALAIARSLLIDDARQRARERAERGDATPDEGAQADDLPDALGQLVRAEELGALREALAQLPGETRELFGLRFGDGLRTGEIAALLGLKEAAVRQRLSRGLRALQQSLTAASPEGFDAAAKGEPV
jgi:RNA polymerase sigma-70 factor (ECF subfamily)